MIRLTFLIALTLGVSTAASAAEPRANPAVGAVHRLSPQDAQAVQDAAANRNVDELALLDDRSVPDGRIHGEIGFEVGSGGYTSVFGTTVVPLGSDGFAAFSFERSDFGRRRFRY